MTTIARSIRAEHRDNTTTVGGLVLSGISGLITSVATLISAIGSLVGILWVVRSGSRREREDTAEKVLNPPPAPVEQVDMVSQMAQKRKRRSRRG